MNIKAFFIRRKPTARKSQPEAAHSAFRDAMKSLPYIEWKAVRGDLIKTTGISRATFSNWINYGVPRRKTDREAVNAVLKRHGYKPIDW